MQTKSTRVTHHQWLVEAIKNHVGTGCLIWPFACTVGIKRYGGCPYRGTVVAAHRLAFYLANGRWPIPCGRHTCDVPKCVNPAHIVEGTHLQNMADMVARGRHQHGAKHSMAKLTDAQVIEIREAYRAGEMCTPIANRYGMTVANICRIVNRKIWRHI